MYYYYVYITMIVYFLTDVMKWLGAKWNQLMKLAIPVWSSIGQDFCVPSMHNREFKFGYQHFLLCQKSFLKVSSKWLLKNKSDNGKLLLGKTFSGERFRAILALLFPVHKQINTRMYHYSLPYKSISSYRPFFTLFLALLSWFFLHLEWSESNTTSDRLKL